MKVVDLRGCRCMDHIVKLERETRDYTGVFEVICSDSSALLDITAWAQRKGVEILEQKKDGDIVRFVMRKR
ncbi:putative redox protein, regulator of disulfide bond formation [Geoglobus ahangari]|uniref:Putative redox protein, regulator of disulfide bond formation n=1 Tax=Geoglobus ahangari TaxID=113653 RepID=A0A0F7IEB4_9EURY|nr:sulfurtransferase TusA family protein [Geoglobus ahangari]AKG91029.1 putative redox protein, regulator of disulfide bond formation [Geoglobus ahangari]